MVSVWVREHCAKSEVVGAVRVESGANKNIRVRVGFDLNKIRFSHSPDIFSMLTAPCNLSNDMSNVYLYSSVTASARETNPNTRALELIPPLPHARNNRHVTNTLRAAHDEHVSTNLLHLTDAPPNPDFALRSQTRALTTTGPGLYTHQVTVQLLAPHSVWSSP